MSKKHKRKKLKSQWSDKKWRKALKGGTIRILNPNQIFTPEGIIQERGGIYRPYYPPGTPVSPPSFDIWKGLGLFKHESTPGFLPGTWKHTFTDPHARWKDMSQEESEEREQ